MIEWVLVHWSAIALAIVPLLAIRYCWEFRENMNLPAWLFYAVFVASFFASNTAAVVPIPDERTLDAARVWVADVQLYQEISYKACVVAGFGIALFAAIFRLFKGSTLLLMATLFLALFGEFLESSYCRVNDPVRNVSHIYLFNGGRNPTCMRLVEFEVAPWMAWFGRLFVPTLTVIPSLIAMRHTAKRKRGST